MSDLGRSILQAPRHEDGVVYSNLAGVLTVRQEDDAKPMRSLRLDLISTRGSDVQLLTRRTPRVSRSLRSRATE